MRLPNWSLLSFGVSNIYFMQIYYCPNGCYMFHLSHSPSLDQSSNIWWSVQIVKLLITQFSPFFYYFLFHMPKYCHQHFVLKQPHFIFFAYKTECLQHFKNILLLWFMWIPSFPHTTDYFGKLYRMLYFWMFQLLSSISPCWMQIMKQLRNKLYINKSNNVNVKHL